MRLKFSLVPNRTHSYHHTALSEISNKIAGKYYYTLFDIKHYFSSDVGFTNIVVQSTRQYGAETKYGVPTVQGQCKVSICNHQADCPFYLRHDNQI